MNFADFNLKEYNITFCKKTNCYMFVHYLNKKFGFDIFTNTFFDDFDVYVNNIDTFSVDKVYRKSYTSEDGYVRKLRQLLLSFKKGELTPFYFYAKDHLPVIDDSSRYYDSTYSASYLSKYKSLVKGKATNISLYVPKNLSDDILLESLESYRLEHPEFAYHLEFAKVFIGMVVFKYMEVRTYKYKCKFSTESLYNKSLHNGFAQFSFEDITEILGIVNGHSYREALVKSGIILCDDVYYSYENNKKAYGYKINPKFFKNDEKDDLSVYNKYVVTLPEAKYRLTSYRNRISKLKKTAKILKDAEYKQMEKDVIALLGNISVDDVRKLYKDDPYAYYNIPNGDIKQLKRKLKDDNQIHIDEFINTLVFIQDGNYYFNVCDTFGNRFHSPLTNLKSWIRQLISYNGKQYMNVDIVNSQFAIFANIIEYPEQIKKLLAKTEWKSHNGKTIMPLNDILDTITVAKTEYFEWKFEEYCQNNDISNLTAEELEVIREDMNHFQKFAKSARDGKLYEDIAGILNKDRTYGKTTAMKIIFGDENQFYQLKKKLFGEYGDVIKIAGLLNGNKECVSCLPKLLQTVEATIVMNIISRFRKKTDNPTLSIHDSWILAVEDLEIFMEVYKEYMAEIGLPEFLMKVEYFIHPNNMN
jgi:hypothetical protein